MYPIIDGTSKLWCVQLWPTDLLSYKSNFLLSFEHLNREERKSFQVSLDSWLSFLAKVIRLLDKFEPLIHNAKTEVCF